MDKNKELSASITLVNDKLKFSANVEGNPPFPIDYIPPLGDNLGYTSLELLLLSLSSCVGSAVLTFLRKMNKTIETCVISSNGIRNDEHPTGFREIYTLIEIKSSDVTVEDMDKVISLTEEKYCPVYSMLKGNVDINIDSDIKR
ncbi:MAG TPA: OsmC family protein [Candidatus Kapabacteria bacterium]|nr:OsmC family protein [Candidatus Kapabacteria bacterium]